MTTGSKPLVSRETLEDRYEGLMWRHFGGDADHDDEVTRLYGRFLGAFTDLASGIARCHPDEITEAGLTVELDELVRDHLIRRIEELGLARVGYAT